MSRTWMALWWTRAVITVPMLSAGSIGLHSDTPPSAASTWPVTQSNSSRARMAWATPSGVPTSPNAERSATRSRYPGSRLVDANIGVSVVPGATALTRIPKGPSSRAATRTSSATPALDTL